MKNKIIIPTILFGVVFAAAITILFQNKEKKLTDYTQENIYVTGNTENTEKENIKNIENDGGQEAALILYYGDGCPHCAVVESYIKDNKIDEKLSLTQKEVYHNKANSEELFEKAKICSINENYIGVPFLWDGAKCYIGDVEIKNFLNQKINEKENK